MTQKTNCIWNCCFAIGFFGFIFFANIPYAYAINATNATNITTTTTTTTLPPCKNCIIIYGEAFEFVPGKPFSFTLSAGDYNLTCRFTPIVATTLNESGYIQECKLPWYVGENRTYVALPGSLVAGLDINEIYKLRGQIKAIESENFWLKLIWVLSIIGILGYLLYENVFKEWD